MIDASKFPNLLALGYEETSKASDLYNCIAHAAGVEDEWWDPQGAWPDDIGAEDSLDNLIAVYERHGFERCVSGEIEAGFDKLAIYGFVATGNVSYEHAAKLAADGRWISKLGPDEDITHHSLAALEGGMYGTVLQLMRRRRP